MCSLVMSLFSRDFMKTVFSLGQPSPRIFLQLSDFCENTIGQRQNVICCLTYISYRTYVLS